LEINSYNPTLMLFGVTILGYIVSCHLAELISVLSFNVLTEKPEIIFIRCASVIIQQVLIVFIFSSLIYKNW
jgi:hypothetical protein